MVIFPNAKINLGLHVVAKRADGYHDIETVFYPFHGVSDALEIISARELNFSGSGKSIPGADDDNLCMKAYRLLKNDFDLSPVSVHLLKNIPIGAGLGGGSADGSFMLRLLNQYFDLQLSDERLAAYAARLGSDCPFFIYNRPLLATGTGTIFEDCNVDLSTYHLVLLCPSVHVSTAQAYAGVLVKTPEVSIKEVLQLPLADWKERLKNDFEISVFKAFPELQKLKEKLYASGAIYAAMSGSGSALFGIFQEAVQLDEKAFCSAVFYQASKSK